MEASYPLRILTSVRSVLHYVKGTRHRRKAWMQPFPLLGYSMGDHLSISQGELILLIVPRNSQASVSHKADEWLMVTYAQLAEKIFHVPCCLCARVRVCLCSWA